MAAGIWNPTIEQGETWVRVVTFTDGNNAAIDMTDWTARMTIRNQYTRAEIAVLTSPSAGIVITALTGTVTLTLTATQTDALPALPRNPYDLELVDAAGTVHKWLRGTVTVVESETT